MNAIVRLTADDISTTVNHEPRIMDLRLAEALGFTDQHKIRVLIDRHKDSIERFASIVTTKTETSKKRGRPGNAYWLTKKQALYICTKSETERATEVTIEMVEVFDEVTSRRFGPAKPTGNVVMVKAHRRYVAKVRGRPRRAERIEFLRRLLGDVSTQLFELGDVWPVCVHGGRMHKNPLGEEMPVDTSRSALRLPTGALVIPIAGGGWQYESPDDAKALYEHT